MIYIYLVPYYNERKNEQKKILGNQWLTIPNLAYVLSLLIFRLGLLIIISSFLQVNPCDY